jgi:glucose-1-phosphate thymidylyltransferase
MKGIILAGGYGTRLHPLTKAVSKQLLPVYDKPLIYYPLSVLMLAGIRDILIITTPEEKSRFQKLLKDGSNLGINLNFVSQPFPNGLSQAFILGKDFIANDDVCLVLGDNIHYGHGLIKLLNTAVYKAQSEKLATVFAYYVKDSSQYGVIEFDSDGNAITLEEKPKIPKSNYAVTGLYFYPNDVIEKASKVIPSERGEFEITSINNDYLLEKRLSVEVLGRGFTWMDTGTPESLLSASIFIETIEKRQNLKIACLEEISYRKGFISKSQLLDLIEINRNNQYLNYLLKISEE